MTHMQVPVGAVPSDGSTVCSVQRDLTLFDWLFMRLDASEPQLPIPRKLRRDIDQFHRRVLRDGYYEFEVHSSGDILCELFPRPQSATEARCGLKLLQFVGGFSDAIALTHANVKVPPVHMARMMIQIGAKEFKGLEVRAGGKRIASSSKFEEKFGVSVNVPIPKQHRYDFVWDLTDMLDRQEE